MLTALRVFKKELGGYFNSPQAYIFLVVFLVVGPAMFFYLGLGDGFFRAKQAVMDGFFMFVPWLFLFFVPAVAMRLWSEEKRSGTEELLMTLPVRDWEVVIGKYLSGLFLITFAIVCTFPLAFVVNHFADESTPVDWGPIIGGYIATFLLGAAILAIGSWASSITVNQIVAFIITCVLTFTLIIIGLDATASVLPSTIHQILAEFSLIRHFTSLYRGLIDASDIAYFLSVVVFFLFLNVRSVESRKWK